MKYWQVGAGEGDRDYSDVFLRFGVAFGGDASRGPYENDPNYYDDNKYVVYFKKKMSFGDRIILKKPHRKKWEIVAVGEIKSVDYKYFEVFDDMDGWNVAHGREVRWVVPIKTTLVKGLAQGTVFPAVSQNLIEKAERILQSGKSKSVEKIPEPQKMLTDEEIEKELTNLGCDPSDLRKLIEVLPRLRLLGNWYLENGKDVGDHETRTFLITPLLLALGWSEKQMKVEWKRKDITFFARPYIRDDNSENPCVMILESKGLEEGLTYARSQAIDYAKSFPHCRKLVVSNGICYKLYELDNYNWKYKSYLNILKPRLKHPYEPQVGGAIELFFNLIPQR